MEKPAETRYPVHDLIRRRWSPLAFADRPVEPEKLGALLEAARWSASSYNQQPWAFLVATKSAPAEFDRMLGCLVDANAAWARQAPVLMIAVAKLAFDHNGKPNRHAMHDVGAAVAQMSLQAVAMGLFAHPMAGFLVDKTREVYGVPPDWEPATAVAIGYPGDPGGLSDALRQREQSPRVRKPLDQFVFAVRWGQPARW